MKPTMWWLPVVACEILGCDEPAAAPNPPPPTMGSALRPAPRSLRPLSAPPPKLADLNPEGSEGAPPGKEPLLYIDTFAQSRRLPDGVVILLAGSHPPTTLEQIAGTEDIQFIDVLACESSGAAATQRFMEGPSLPKSVCVVPIDDPDLDKTPCAAGCPLVWCDGPLTNVLHSERPVVRVDAATWRRLEAVASRGRVCIKRGKPIHCGDSLAF